LALLAGGRYDEGYRQPPNRAPKRQWLSVAEAAPQAVDGCRSSEAA